MIPLVMAVFLASLMGSLHCAGMCGAFLTFAVADGQPGSRIVLQTGYHGGRLVTYASLGVLAGGLGALADVVGALAGLQPIAAACAGAMIVVFGSMTLLRLLGARLPWPSPPRWMERALQAGHRAAFRLTPPRRAFAIGLLTTLLPCGWLYAFAITAAGTAHPVRGGLVMAAFWLGTLPTMVALGAGIQEVLGVVGRRIPVITCLILIVVGLLTLSGRIAIDPATLADAVATHSAENAAPVAAHPPCHDAVQ